MGGTFCYEGTESNVVTAGRLDPLACHISGFEAQLLRGNCSSAGFGNYMGNDPVCKEVGLWFKEVDCSIKGNCFNVSGARNSDPTLPAGANLNGKYAITNHTCWGLGV